MIKKYGFESLGWITLQGRGLVVDSKRVAGTPPTPPLPQPHTHKRGRGGFLSAMIRAVGKVCREGALSSKCPEIYNIARDKNEGGCLER